MNSDEPTLVEDPIVEASPPEKKKPPKEPTRLGRFFSRVVRWAAAIGLIFAFGVVLTWLVRVIPLVLEVRDIRADLTAAEAQIADLEQTVSELQELEESIVSLQADLTSAELHISLLNILSEIHSARLALANNDPIAAHAALADTDGRMSELQESLQGEDANTVVGLRVRLQQSISEIDSNAFAAEGDLGILSNDLRNLEQKVFGD